MFQILKIGNIQSGFKRDDSINDKFRGSNHIGTSYLYAELLYVR